jgi:hypothetical protein
MAPQGDPHDPTLHDSDALDAGALPGDAQLSDDQIDDLNQAGNRGDYGDADLGGQDAGSHRAVDPGAQSEGEHGGKQEYPDAADPANPDQGANSGVAGSGI